MGSEQHSARDRAGRRSRRLFRHLREPSLGRPVHDRLLGINWRATHEQAREALQKLGLGHLNPRAPLKSLSLAVQQLVAISRSMVTNAKVLILDEPTSSLDSAEVEQLFTVMRRLRDEGVAILFAARLRRRPARDRVGRTRGHRRRRQHARRGAEAPHRLSSENRRDEGIIRDLSVRENIILGVQAKRGWARPLPRKETDEIVAKYISELYVRPADPELPISKLSGGNQQKVLLGRWLATRPQILILDEPTRGIDIGAKAEIQERVLELASEGVSVVFISSELEEVVRLSDRIVGVNRRGLLLAVYAISALMAGIAGIFATASVMTVDVSRTGDQLEMDAILAVVIGGTSLAGGKFNITGATIGAPLIATLDKTVVFLGVSSSATPAFNAIVIVVLRLLQSDRIRSAFKRRPAPAAPTDQQKEEVAAA